MILKWKKQQLVKFSSNCSSCKFDPLTYIPNCHQFWGSVAQTHELWIVSPSHDENLGHGECKLWSTGQEQWKHSKFNVRHICLIFLHRISLTTHIDSFFAHLCDIIHCSFEDRSLKRMNSVGPRWESRALGGHHRPLHAVCYMAWHNTHNIHRMAHTI